MSKRISWAVRLERAEANKGFSKYEKRLADSWQTCAVGEKHNWADSPFWSVQPNWFDSDENRLGIEFMFAVRENDVLGAKEAYAKLQALP